MLKGSIFVLWKANKDLTLNSDILYYRINGYNSNNNFIIYNRVTLFLSSHCNHESGQKLRNQTFLWTFKSRRGNQVLSELPLSTSSTCYILH